MNRVYVSDTNIWIDFRNAGLLDELFGLPLTLCCTDFVMAELEDFDHMALVAQGLVVEVLDATAMPRLSALMTTHNNSSLPDVSCYMLAKDSGRPLLTGDGRLRTQARQEGLEVHGVLWLLDQMVLRAVIAPARAAAGLEQMLARNARLPHAECQARLNAWKV